MEPKRVTALAKRLGRRTSLTTADVRARLAALDAMTGDGVVLEIFSRYMRGTERVEQRRYLGLRFRTLDGALAEVALRVVKAKPGYTRTNSTASPSNQQEKPDATVQS
jgi:hypothetical protein